MSAKLYSRQKMLEGTNLSFDREITIGRGQQNKVVLGRKEVSKKHLRIFFDEKQKCFILEDFGSANGTHLDDIRVEGKAQLRHLNVISIAGVYDFIFQDIHLCKARHPDQKQKESTLKQQPKIIVQKNISVTPPKLGKKEELSTAAHSQTVVAGGHFSLPPELKKTQKKSEGNISETVVGEGAFILPPELGETKEPSVPAHSQTIVAGGGVVLPSWLGEIKEQPVPDPSKTVLGQTPLSLPPTLGTGREDEAKTVFPESKIETVVLNQADRFSPEKHPPPKQSFFLEIQMDENRTQRFALKEGENVIGRKAPADIIIEKIEVSRQHAILTVKDGSVYLRDADSKNKTFVDEQKVIKTLEIQPSHALRFGFIKAKIVVE